MIGNVGTYMGYTISINDEIMSDVVEDWSNVRAPNRAIRRLKRGFKQKIIYRRVPKPEALLLKEQNTMIMHSVFYHELKKKVEESENYIRPLYF